VKYKNGMYSSQTKINKKEDIPIVDKGDTLYIYMGTRTLYKYTATNEIMSIIINREINDMNICQIAQSIIDRVKLNYENYASQNEDIMKYDDMKYDDNISIGLLKIKF
jgi:hypothetical protein